MELDDLHVLIHLSDHGSLRGAAQKLGVSRSAMRRQLERLEQSFETALVVREGRGMRLTPAGELAVARARPLIAKVGAMVEQVRAAAGEASGVVRLLLPIGMPAAARVGALHELTRRYRSLALDLREVPDPLRWTHLPFDLMAHFGPPPEGMDLVTSVLAHTQRVLLASRAYLDEHGAPASVAELAERRLLLWRLAGRPDDQLPRADGSWVSVRPWVESSDAAVIVEAARQGLGLAFVPRLVAAEAALEPVLGAELGDTVTLRLSSQRPSRVDPQVAALLDNVHRMLETMGPTG